MGLFSSSPAVTRLPLSGEFIESHQIEREKNAFTQHDISLGLGKSTYKVPVTFRFPLPARLQWLEPAGGKWKSADVERKTYMLIYPDPILFNPTRKSSHILSYWSCA
jgi:hypothetical protein